MKSADSARATSKGRPGPALARQAPAPRQPSPPSLVSALHAAAGNAAVGHWARSLRGATDPGLAARTLSRPGQPLETGLRHEMERRFGQDFGGVRVHADGLAERSARAERASAYTVGDSIVFGAGRLPPNTPGGRLLVAHELAHVIQQRRRGGEAANGVEEGADQAALDLARGRRPRVTGAGGTRLARSPADEQHQAKYAEWGQAYQTLRRLEEQAYHRVHELHGQGRAYEAAQREKRATTTGKAAGEGPDLASYAVQYSVHDGKLVSYISAERGKRRGVQEKPGEKWVGAGKAGSDEEQHAERNTLRLGPGEPITAAASRPHCESCARAMAEAGVTGAERRKPGRMQGTSKPHVEAERRRLLAVPHEIGTALERILTIKDPSSPRPGPQILGKGGPGQRVTGSGHPAPAASSPQAIPASDAAHATSASGVPHESAAIGAAHAAGGPGSGPPPSASSVAHPSPGAKDARPGPGAGVTHGPAAAGSTGAAPATTGVRPPAADRQPARERGAQIAPGVFRHPAASGHGDGAERHQGYAPTGSAETGWAQFAETVKKVEPEGKAGASPRSRADKAVQQDPPTRTRTPPHKPPVTPAGTAARRAATAQAPAQAQTPAAPTPPAPARPGPPGEATPAPAPSPAPKPPSPQLRRVAPPGSRTPSGEGPSGGAAALGPAHQPSAAVPPHTTPAAVPPRQTTRRATARSSGSGAPPSASPATGTGGPAAKSTVQPDPVKPKIPGKRAVVSHATTDEPRPGVVTARPKSSSLDRGNAKLGVSRTTGHRSGQEDEHGNLVRGHEVSRSAGAGLVAGPGRMGGHGSAGAQAVQAHGGGFTTNQSIGAEGQATVDVQPVPGTTPPQFQLTVTLTLGGHVSIGGGLERGRAGVTGSVSVQGSVTGVFTHIFAKEQVDAYLGALKDPSIGGAEKELAIVRLATEGSLQEAKSMLAAAGTASLSSRSVGHMREGDSAEVTVQGGAELKGGANVQGGAFGGGLSVSLSRSGSLRRQVVIEDGKAVVTVDVLAGRGAGGEASASFLGVGLGAGYGKQETTGESVTFSANPYDATSLDRIFEVDSVSALRSLAVSPGGAVVLQKTESQESTTTSSATVSLGVQAGMTNQHSYGEKTITTAEGVTKEYTGASGTQLVVGGWKSGQTQAVDLQGGPDNQGAGDVSTTTTQSSLAKSLQSAQDAPLGTALGLATGDTPLFAEEVEVVGMKLSNADFDRLSAAAADSDAWKAAFGHSKSIYTASLDNARALMAKVRSARGDRQAIAKAFAEYAEDNYQAAEFVQELVRPWGETQGGRRYDWPSKYHVQQSWYESLVLGDPRPAADRLAAAGQGPIAVVRLRHDIDQLDIVAATVDANQEEFSDKAAAIEMLRSIRRRQADLEQKVRELQSAPPLDAAKSDPANQDPAKSPAQATGEATTVAPTRAAPDPARVSWITAQIDRYIADFKTNRASERERFDDFDSEFDHWYRGPDFPTVFGDLTYLKNRLYPNWDLQVEDIKKLYQELGQDPSQALAYGPDRARWNRYNNDPRLHRW